MRIVRAAAFVLAVFAAGLGLGARESDATTAPARVAVVDVAKILSESKAGKSATAALKKKQDAALAQVKALEDGAAKIEQRISERKRNATIQEIEELQMQANDIRAEARRQATSLEREIGEARDRELAGLETRIKPVIDAISKERGLALVFDKFESGLVYASDAVDVTDAVVERFDAAAP